MKKWVLFMHNLKEFVESNPKLVTRKVSKNYPGLYVLKYKNNCFYDNLWHKSTHLLGCRGRVVDSDWNEVIIPFKKIFNHNENGAGSEWRDADYVLLTKKINGFMIGLTNHNGEIIFSTTGSLDSDFIAYAKDYLSKVTPAMCRKHHTYIFEICHPDDPHIIPEENGAYLLGIVEHDNGNHHYKFDNSIVMEDAKEEFSKLGIFCGEEDIACMQFGDLLEHIKTVKHEGYVIVNPRTDETIKLKSPYYTFNKFLARIGTKKLIDGIRTGIIKQKVDEEYYPVINQLIDFGVDKFSELTEQERLLTLKTWIGLKNE